MHMLSQKKRVALLREGYRAGGLRCLPQDVVYRGFIIYVGGDLAPFRIVLDLIGTRKSFLSLRVSVGKAAASEDLARELTKKGMVYEIYAEVAAEAGLLDEAIHLLNGVFSAQENLLLLAA